jgi:hypothetical protein
MGLILRTGSMTNSEPGHWPTFRTAAPISARLPLSDLRSATGMTPPSTTPGSRLQTGWQAKHKGLRTGDERPALATCF